MKRHTLTLVALAASLLTARSSLAENAKPAAPTPPAHEKQQKLIKMATLQDAQANREFQANVQLLQAQRQAAIQLNTAIEKEKDAKKKQELKTQLDQLMTRLNENNEKMRKIYGFSLTRNYTLEIETASIYMVVSDEEAAQIEKEQAAAKKAKK